LEFHTDEDQPITPSRGTRCPYGLAMTVQRTAEPGIDRAAAKSAEDVVRTFIAALERLDLDAAVALAAPKIRWVNVPWKTATDKARFKKVLEGMFKDAKRFEVQYFDIHERGDGVVYTDRVDIFEGGGLTMNLPVRGEFRVQDGLITEWVDRFSWTKLVADMSKSLPGIVKYRLGR
jgi:limonene-1,2-epoxide hydrolase